jgi:glucosamine kinase
MSKYDSSDHAQFYIGVDGGGTSCRARIEDAEGRLLAGPCLARREGRAPRAEAAEKGAQIC